MNSTTLFRALAFAALLLASTLRAQVPQLINYQGRVAVGTPPVNFDGTGSFKFALVNAAGTTTFWSNDGTSTAGSPPTAAVTLTVTKGLYSVLLGDATLADMTAIPNSVFANSDVRLRVWFNDGTNGFQLLTPDQRIAAVGYAMIAASVPDGAITSSMIATGAVGSAQIAANAVQSSNIAVGAVTGTQIAAGAVTGTQIAAGAIDFTRLAKPPQAGVVESGVIAFQVGVANLSVVFPNPFTATPVVTVSLASTSAPLPGESTIQVTSTSATQFTAKVSGLSASPATVDSANAGNYNSLAVVNGSPAVSYLDGTSLDLKYARAADAAGTAWGTPVTIDSGGVVGAYTTLVVVNGNPAISYKDQTNEDLKYVRATDTNGTTWGTPVSLDTAIQSGTYSSMAVVNGNPAISYQGNINFDTRLKYVRAIDASGTTWGTPVTVEISALNGCGDTSLVVVNGNPAIAYFENDGNTGTNKLKYVRATNANGTTWATPQIIDSAGSVGEYNSLAVINGNPAISYHDRTNGNLKYVRANDANGASWGTPLVIDSIGIVGEFTSMTVVVGNPAISYHDATNFDLKYVRAENPSGTTWSKPVIMDSIGLVGRFTSIEVVDGAPAISYYDQTNADLKFIRPPTAFKVNWIALPP